MYYIKINITFENKKKINFLSYFRWLFNCNIIATTKFIKLIQRKFEIFVLNSIFKITINAIWIKILINNFDDVNKLLFVDFLIIITNFNELFNYSIFYNKFFVNNITNFTCILFTNFYFVLLFDLIFQYLNCNI